MRGSGSQPSKLTLVHISPWHSKGLFNGQAQNCESNIIKANSKSTKLHSASLQLVRLIIWAALRSDHSKTPTLLQVVDDQVETCFRQNVNQRWQHLQCPLSISEYTLETNQKSSLLYILFRIVTSTLETSWQCQHAMLKPHTHTHRHTHFWGDHRHYSCVDNWLRTSNSILMLLFSFHAATRWSPKKKRDRWHIWHDAFQILKLQINT